MSRHLAKSYIWDEEQANDPTTGEDVVFRSARIDNESGLYHLQHLAYRALMEYTRLSRGIVHENDKS